MSKEDEKLMNEVHYSILQGGRSRFSMKLSELTYTQKIKWDFSRFDDPVFGQIATTKLEDFTIVSTLLPGEDTEVSVFIADGTEEMKVIDSFRGLNAQMIRNKLNRLAWLDKDFKARQELKDKSFAKEERLSSSESIKKNNNLLRVTVLLYLKNAGAKS